MADALAPGAAVPAGGVEVRPADDADAAAVAAIYAWYVAGTTVSFELEPPDAAEITQRMLSEPRLPWLVAVRGDGAVVGYCYASGHRSRAAYAWSVDVSVYLHRDHVGRGIGRRLYRSLLPALADLGYVAAFAGIALPNPASVALHRSVGFAPVGTYQAVGFKHGRWHDVGWWQRPLVPPPADPVPPRGWTPG